MHTPSSGSSYSGHRPTEEWRPAAGEIPTDPGVYTFRDALGRVIYVGKAKNLRARLSNYFQNPAQLHPRTRLMVHTAQKVQWTVVDSELEALNLEHTWIKRFDPRFNVVFKDDKTYPMIALTVKERIPRVSVYRGAKRKGVRYFGPYPQVWAIRETIESLTRVFPIRTCTKGVYNRHESLGRPCLLGYIDRCSAPCVGKISAEDHRAMVNQFASFLGGNTAPVVKRVRADMEVASENLDFEKAASLRDQLIAMDKAMERQAVVFSDSTDADVIAVSSDDLEIAIQIFHVRGGRIHGQQGWVVERESTDEETVAQLIMQFYGEEVELEQSAKMTEITVGGADSGNMLQPVVIPREILVPVLPDNVQEIEQWLSDMKGSKVHIRVPQRGDKKQLLGTVETNAVQALARHKLKRASDITARSAALQELQEALWMDQSPLRIECVDISHIQGTDVVASLVVFEDGLPKKQDYRRYKIKEAAGQGHSDDVASIAEVTRRRFMRHNEDFESSEDAEKQIKRFAYPPQLFIVDGGQPQVRAAQSVLDELGISDVMVVGIAKRLEELWTADDDYPVIMSRSSEALYMVQHLRDEAHRYAITFHRQQRSSRMRKSVLDDIPGLGPQRRKQLIKEFGSVKKLKEASVEDISALPGFGGVLADAVYSALNT